MRKLRLQRLDSHLDRLRWTHPRLPIDTSVLIGPAEAIDQLELTRLEPSDESGATGLLLALLSARFGVDTDRIELHRAGPDRRYRGGHRPASASAGPGTTPLFTSLARTPGCVVAAVSRRRIGVDIEQTQTDEQGRDLLSLAHPADRASVTRTNRATWVARMARAARATRADSGSAGGPDSGLGWAATMIWTRVEACLKLRGSGLRVDPSVVRVGAGPGPRYLSRVQTLTTGCDRFGQPTDPTWPDSAAPYCSVSLAWERQLPFRMQTQVRRHPEGRN